MFLLAVRRVGQEALTQTPLVEKQRSLKHSSHSSGIPVSGGVVVDRCNSSVGFAVWEMVEGPKNSV